MHSIQISQCLAVSKNMIRSQEIKVTEVIQSEQEESAGFQSQFWIVHKNLRQPQNKNIFMYYNGLMSLNIYICKAKYPEILNNN